MKVNVVIVTWNQVALLEQCVNSVHFAASQSDVEVVAVIVDNASEPESNVHISQLPLPADWSKVHLKQNIGYSAALNLGTRTLSNTPSDYTVLMNDDCILPQNFFSALSDHTLLTERPAIIGFPLKELLKGRRRVVYGMHYWYQLSLAVPVQRPGNKNKQGFGGPIFYPCGAVIACRSDFLSGIGGVPTQNFLYFEELNLLKAAVSSEELITLCESITIEHVGGASTSSLPRVRSAHYYSTIAALRFTLAHYPIWIPTVLLARALGTAIRMLAMVSFTPAQSFALAIKEFFKWPTGQAARD